jgi:hypothetical protein
MRARKMITTGSKGLLARNGRRLALAGLLAMTALTVGCYGRYPWHDRDRDHDHDGDHDDHHGQLEVPANFTTAQGVIYP